MASDQVSAGNSPNDGNDGRIIVVGLAPPDEGRQRPGMGGYGLQASGLTPSVKLFPRLSMGMDYHQAVIRKLIK
jgi:hypothetical protein